MQAKTKVSTPARRKTQPTPSRGARTDSTSRPALVQARDGKAREENLHFNLGAGLIGDPGPAAVVKLAADVARAVAVLLEFAVTHCGKDVEHFTYVLDIALFRAAELCDDLELPKNCDDVAVGRLPHMMRSTAHGLSASEDLADENLAKLVQVLAATLRQTADCVELRCVGTPGTLATAANKPRTLAIRLEESLARLREQNTNAA